MYYTLHKIWVPTIVVCVLPKDSYQVHTSDGIVYHHTRQHLHECSVKPADTVPDATTTTLQAPARPCISVPQPAPTKPVHPAQTHTCCTHNSCNPKAADHSCSHHTSCPKGCPCTYTCNTQCSPHAAQKIRSCSCSIQVPHTGDVIILLPMTGDP